MASTTAPDLDSVLAYAVPEEEWFAALLKRVLERHDIQVLLDRAVQRGHIEDVRGNNG